LRAGEENKDRAFAIAEENRGAEVQNFVGTGKGNQPLQKRAAFGLQAGGDRRRI